jgi:hypothetical protein
MDTVYVLCDDASLTSIKDQLANGCRFQVTLLHTDVGNKIVSITNTGKDSKEIIIHNPRIILNNKPVTIIYDLKVCYSDDKKEIEVRLTNTQRRSLLNSLKMGGNRFII